MIVAIIICLGFAVSAFFSGAETALVSINWIRLEHWVEKERAGARALQKFVAAPRRVIGMTVAGTNVAEIMTSSVVSWQLSRLLSDWPAGYVGLLSTAGVTVAMLIFGEVIPKVIGRRHSDAIIFKVVHPLRVAYWVLLPVIWFATGIAGLLLRAFGIRTRRWRKRLTKDQLRLLLTSEGERAGAVDVEETKLISGIFEFALTTVGEVMVPRTDVVGLSGDPTVGEAIGLVREHGYTRPSLFSPDRDHIESMVHSLDLLGLAHDDSVEALLRPAPHEVL